MDTSDEQSQLPHIPATQDDSNGQQSVQSGGQQNDSQQSSQQDDTQLPGSAGDVDLIEKAWVEKAKEIVEQTTGDPHKQTEQINNMKAEYIKKRYGKEIKTKNKG